MSKSFQSVIIGTMAACVFATATVTVFQTNDSHRVLDLAVQTNSPTVTRIESVPVKASVVIPPRPITFRPRIVATPLATPRPSISPKPRVRSYTKPRRASRSVAPMTAPSARVDISDYPYYAEPHQIYHTSNCPDGPQWVKDLAHQMVADKFGEDQWSYASRLWTRESNFNPWCEASSGAYGVPQALPGRKMGGNWRYDVRQQISWGLGYIDERYDTPEAAWAHSQAHNWY